MQDFDISNENIDLFCHSLVDTSILNYLDITCSIYVHRDLDICLTLP
jgi:hypothetical protein